MILSRITAVVCVVLAFAYYLFTESLIGLVLLLITLGVPLVSILLNQLFSRKLSAELRINQMAEKHEALVGCLLTTNGRLLSLAPVSCTIVCKNRLTDEEFAFSALFPVGGRRGFELPFSLVSKHCGSVELRVQRLQVYDIFGLFSTRCTTDAQAMALVLPKTFPINFTVLPNMTKDIEADEYSQTKAGSDPSETFALRDYRPGDSLKKIHWKITSKLDHLVVKEMGLPVRHSFLLLLETFYPIELVTSAQTADALAEITVSLCQTLVEEEISFDVAWQDQETNQFVRYHIASMDDFTGILSKMLSATAVAGQRNAFSCYEETFGACEFEHLVYLSRFLPPALESFGGDGQLTAIICGEELLNVAAGSTDGYTVHYCTPQTYEVMVSNLEL